MLYATGLHATDNTEFQLLYVLYYYQYPQFAQFILYTLIVLRSSLAVSMEAVLLSRDALITLHKRAPCPGAVKLLEWLISLIDPLEVNTVRNTIVDLIDIDSTSSSGELTVRMGVCSRLDKLRSDFSALPDALRAVGRLILDETEMPQVLVALYLSLLNNITTLTVIMTLVNNLARVLY